MTKDLKLSYKSQNGLAYEVNVVADAEAVGPTSPYAYPLIAYFLLMAFNITGRLTTKQRASD